jgi:hypothetical protein
MRANGWWIAILLAGCGSAGPESETLVEPPPAPSTAAPAPIEEPEPGFVAADPELPEGPWTADPVAPAEAPRVLVTAWSTADNRDWCAAIVPTETAGARPRRARFEGGWAVEFDARGLAGVRPNGRACESCGRGAFGIAGTAARVDDEDPMEAEVRRWRDGSWMRLEESTDEETTHASGHVATLRIRGQECLYQVWSFVSDEHLEGLVASLRFIAAEPPAP